VPTARPLYAAALLMALSACDDSDEEEPTNTTGFGGHGAAGAEGGAGANGGAGAMGGGGGGGQSGADWQKCSLITDGNDGSAQCATFSMPALRDDASAGAVDVFVKRVAATAPRRGSLWLLSGGPGQSGISWEGLATFVQAMAPDLDIMIPDHRGTGRSDRLACPDEEAVGSADGPGLADSEIASCASHLVDEWGDTLAAFNNTQAAHDIGELIERTREPGDEPYVYGVSYGSQWAHRYLQIFPDQAAGVVLEASCVPNCRFDLFDVWQDALAQTYLTRCGQDAFCSAKLGADPWAQAGSMYQGLSSCTGVDARLDEPTLKRFLAWRLYSREERTLVPAIVVRANRCSPADVNALNHLAAFIFAPLPNPLPLPLRYDSNQLTMNVVLVDAYADPPPELAALETAYEASTVGLGLSVKMRKALDVWPLYAKDPYFGGFAAPQVPVLMVQGDLDFIPVPYAQTAANALAGAGFTFLVLPDAPHGASFSSPLVAGHCGARVLQDFWANPSQALDVSCVDNLLPPDFTPNVSVSEIVLGTQDAYDGDPGPVQAANVAALIAASPKAQEIHLQRWRHRPR